ncbi:MAG: efflux RND transporter permease subunit, partial [Alphaproteobacteria bacterium]|nr:efflux RND transporter permease subunit [Alphaproteobacteria bacterium]
PILTQGDAVVTLSEVATIRRTFKDRSSFARLNGQPAVGLEIKKRIGTNVIETVNQVKALVNEHQKRWPSGVRAYFTQDQSLEVMDQVSQLQNNVISAVILVIVVVVVALGARSAGLVGLAIPTSFLFGILVIFSMGLTLNQVVLFGLVLAVGMLVDGAIVVTEYADRKMSEGIERVKAFAMAAKRMSWPIIASVATTLAAFLPLLFWPGVMGEFMGFLPVTLIATLVGSLISALIFLPTLGGLIGRSEARKPDTLTALAATDESDLRDLPGFTGHYTRFLSSIIRHPLEILGVALLLLVGTWGWYATHGNGVEFFPSGDSGLVNLEVRGRGNLSTEEKDALVREVENIVRAVGGVRTMYTTTGAAGNQGPVGDRAAEDRIGRISLELADWRTRPRSDVIIREIRERTSNLAGILVVPSQNDFGPPQGKDVQIQFSSPYPELIEPAMARVRAHMETEVEGLMDIDDSRPLPGIQWEIEVDRAMAQRFRTDVVTVGGMVQLVTNGIKVGEYRPNDADEEIDIRVRFPEEERSIEMLDQLVVQTNEGPIPISNFVTRTAKPQVKTIERLDGSRILTLMANVAPGYLTDTKVRELQSFIQKAEIDPRVQISFRGQTEEQDEAQTFLGNAFIVALFLMAIILVTQFNSFYHALLVLSAVVLSTIGVVLGLIITGRTFVIVMTGIGVIALAGIVVNNNIVLIDTFARLRKAGLEPMAAIVRTGAQRLRPVMLTTITTVVGLMPMFLQLNIDFINREVGAGAPTAEFWV